MSLLFLTKKSLWKKVISFLLSGAHAGQAENNKMELVWAMLRRNDDYKICDSDITLL